MIFTASSSFGMNRMKDPELGVCGQGNWTILIFMTVGLNLDGGGTNIGH